jgi:hypothetical protein
MKAFSPQDVIQAQATGAQIPDEVFDIINDMLVKAGSSRIVIKQNELVEAITEMLGVSRQTVFSNSWLNFEPAYRAQGWLVKYDKPAYNENYDPFWIFTTPG